MARKSSSKSTLSLQRSDLIMPFSQTPNCSGRHVNRLLFRYEVPDITNGLHFSQRVLRGGSVHGFQLGDQFDIFTEPMISSTFIAALTAELHHLEPTTCELRVQNTDDPKLGTRM